MSIEYVGLVVVAVPPLSKELFPVGQVGKIKASREVKIFFFSPNFIFHKLECTGGGGKKKKK